MLNVQYIGFNVRQPPFDDARVRQALAMACDKETLASVVLAGYLFPASGGFVPPEMSAHSPDIGLPYNPEQARQRLVQAGYPAGRNFPPVTCLAKADHKLGLDFLSDSWREILGINIEWQPVEWGQLLARLEQNPPQMFRIGWSADYPDPDNLLRMGTHVGRWMGWRQPSYLELVDRAARITDQAERIKLYCQADRILVEEAALIPLTYGRRHMLVKPWVSRFPTSATNWHFWKDVVIEPH